MSSSSGVPYYKKASGAKRRSEQEQREKKEQELLKKVPKIDAYFQKNSASTASSSEAPEAPRHPQESDLAASTSREPEAKSHVITEISIDVQFSETEPVKENKYGVIEVDPAEWNRADDNLKEHLASLGLPDRNILPSFPATKRKYNDCSRSLTPSMFQTKAPDGSVLEREWMIYSESRAAVICFVCRMFSGNKSIFTEGFNDWKNAVRDMRMHEKSYEHRQSMISWVSRRKYTQRIDQHLITQYEKERAYWRSILRRIVSTVKFLSQRGLAFKGDIQQIGSSNNGNYLRCLEYLSEYDPLMASHLEQYGNKGKGNPSYLSWNICDEIIDMMAAKVQSVIISELQASKYYAISVDSTPDLSHVDQLTFTVRYLSPNGQVTERFLQFIDIYGHSAESLSETVQNVLRDLHIDIADCRGLTTDNASNMSGQYNGLQQKLKQVNNLINFVPCAAHSLNLVGVCAAESCLNAVYFFGFLQSLYNFFSASTFRWSVLQNALHKETPVVKNLSVTRWSARADATKALCKGYQNIQQALDSLMRDNSQHAATKAEATRLAKKMTELEIALMAMIWNIILDRFQATSESLQRYEIEVGSVVHLYSSLVGFLETKRTDQTFSEIEQSASKLVNHLNYKQSRKQKHTRLFHDDPSGEDSLTDESASQKFKVQSYFMILDALISEIKRRGSAYSGFYSKFDVFFHHSEMLPSEIAECANVLITCYPELEPEFSDELQHFLLLMSNESDKSPQNMLKVIRNNSLQGTFPNCDVALRIYLCNFGTNVTSERSFSTLKRIKNELRTASKQERMNALSLLCIEQDVVQELDFEDLIDEFAKSKSRKVPLM